MISNRSFHLSAVLLLFIILMFPLTFVNIQKHVISPNAATIVNSNAYTDQEYILIQNDADFEAQGLPGSGTQEDPFLIQNLRITKFVSISHTTYHFIIQNCVFGLDNYSHFLERRFGEGTTLGFAVSLFDIANASIRNCIVRYFSEGFDFKDCINVSVKENYIHANHPIKDRDGCNITIENNIVTRGSRGIVLYGTQGGTVFNNTIFNCEVGIYVLDSTEDNRIYGNRIGYNDRNVEGYNSTVHWDDGVQIGNAWDDYSGEGDYNIPGEGEEVDHYPSQFVDDFMGPEITVIDVPDGIIDIFFYPIHLDFIVNVTDFSGIDDVRLYYRMAFSVASVNSHTDFVSVEMNPEQENSTNARYSYSFEITQGYDSFQYTIMSNDSHGIDSMSLDTYLLGVNDRIILRNKTGEVLILSSVSIAISSIIIAAVIYKRKTNASIIQAP